MTDAQHDLDTSLDIAVIGMSCRFPDAPDLAAFWANLRAGREGIGVFTDDALRARGVPEALLAQPGFVKATPVLDDVEGFDAGFFGYAPAEARLLDPQQRIFLECAWHALEDAGYGVRSGNRATGVFAGTSLSTYLLFNLLTRADIRDAQDSFQVMIGNDKDFLATRVSYHLNLRGPSLDVQTGCSTSLVAAHLACQGLLTYQCDLALAGGVSVAVPQRTGYLHQPGGIASPDGHCRAFDERGQGTVFGSGAGVCVLKRLDEALAAGDHIYAVIKASAINNDGADKVGYTAPSVSGQLDAIVRAHAIARIDPSTIRLVEGHGTGTPLGDPVEIAALNRAFASAHRAGHRCALGSVKSNIGHLDAAAGIASLIKAVLAVAHGEIPPTLHFTQPNSRIAWDEGPFYVNGALEAWPAHAGPRRAGVSSFGIGGTNAHVVVEQAPARAPAAPSAAWQLLPLSARSRGALDRLAAQLAAHLEAHPAVELADVAHTLQVGREPLVERRAVICRDRDAAIASLRTPDTERAPAGTRPARRRGAVFLFPGGGAQYRRMGRALYATEPVFREHLDRCAAILADRHGLALHRGLYADEDGEAKPAALTDPATALPALFAVEYSLARLWMALGVEPAAMLGHSMGEYVAACLAGVFSLEDALALVCERARLFATLPAGGMLSVAQAEAVLAPVLGTELAIAAVNAPDQCAVAGRADAIAALAEDLERRHIEHRRIPIDVAAHSPLVDPVLPAFTAFVARLAPAPPTIPFVSSVTGTWITEAEATSPHYWARHLRQTVRFAPGAATLLADPDHVFVEVGPGRALSSLVKRQATAEQRSMIVPSMPAAKDPAHEREALLDALGRLWSSGVDVDWSRLWADAPRRRVPLPGYPFERTRYWLAPHALDSRGAGTELHKRPDLRDWLYVPSWRRAPLRSARVPDGGDGGGDVLVLADGQGVGQALGQALARALTRAGRRTTVVRAAAAFERVDPTSYAVDPGDPASYQALWRALQAEGRRPRAIVHLWNVDDAATDRAHAADPDRARDLAFDSLLALGQCLGADEAGGPVRLCVVSTGVHAVTGAEDLCPPKALLLGPCKVLPLELPHVTCHHVDLAPPTSEVECERAAAGLLHELDASPPGAVVAYRGPYRWEQTAGPLPIASPTDPAAGLRPGGVYVITGGLGDIGLALAEHLAARVPEVRLALIGRTALPDRAAWPSWLRDRAAGDPTSARIRKLGAMEAQGARVLAVSADVADRAALATALAQVRDQLGPVRGVVHAAGVPAGGLVALKTPAAVTATLAPKVAGTLALIDVLAAAPPDFLLLFSSLSATTGDLGQIDHCAANAVMDAVAHAEAARGRDWVTAVSWDTWSELGQAVTTALPDSLRGLRERVLAHGLRTDEGIELFRRVVGARSPQILVSTRDLPALMTGHVAATRALLDELAARRTSPEPATGAPPAPPEGAVEHQLVEIWRTMLGLPAVGVHDNFFELGGNSLIGLKLIGEIRARLQVELPAVSLFENPTIRALARLIAGSAAGSAAGLAASSGSDTDADHEFQRRRDRGARRRDSQPRQRRAKQQES